MSSPIDYTVFAADTISLLEKLNIGPFVFVGASMGPGETVQAYFQSQYVRDNCKVSLDIYQHSFQFPLVSLS